MRALVLVLVLATLVSSSHAGFMGKNPIKMTGRRVGADDTKINCQSFRLGVEANNLRDWPSIPDYCRSYIQSYFAGKQYGLDVEAVRGAAYAYLDHLGNAKTGDIWIFDVEETLLSNLAYLSSYEVDYGVYSINRTEYYQWLDWSNGVEIPAALDLYLEVISRKYKIYLISEAPESFRERLDQLLAYTGYIFHEELFLKDESDNGKTVAEYKAEKRKELADEGCNIVGNVGDQWTDLTGEHAGQRTFKIPNPVYYVE